MTTDAETEPEEKSGSKEDIPETGVTGEEEVPVEPKKKDPSQYSLVEAAQYGVLERCRELIEKEGNKVTQADAEGITVLHWAAINNRIALAR